MFHTHRTTPSLCPTCGDKLDAATNTDSSSDAPTPGDPSICLNCGAVVVFTEDLCVRRAMDDDFKAWPDEVKAQLLKVMIGRRMIVPKSGLREVRREMKH